MAHNTVVTWKGKMSFDVELDGHHFLIDADEQFGGQDQGPRPKKLLLSALAGCTGMDVVSLLGKMRMPFEKFALEVDGELADNHPKYYTDIVIRYIFYGNELDKDKIEKSVKLSVEKYCAVHHMLAKTANVKHEIVLNPH